MRYNCLYYKRHHLKKIILTTIVSQFFVLLFALDTTILEQKAQAGNAVSAYELAKIYEEQDDKEKAFEWYKKAATLSFENQKKSSALESGLLDNKIKKVERTQEAYGGFLEAYGDEETEKSVKQMIMKTFDISPYKMNYLLPITYDSVNHDDRKHTETKFQLSFQKSLADNFFGLNETFVGAYTQTSWWQTTATSAPFRETNYQPELFMIMPHFEKDSMLKAYKFGILHESNGQGEEKSRSWNRLYAKAFFQFDGLIVSPRVWYRIPEDKATDDNPNIDDYLGYGDLEFIYPWKNHSFKLLVRNNFHFDNTNKGAVQFDWTFPLWEQNLFGYLQLYSGYSESLIDYDKRSDRIGIGFALSR